MPSSAVPQSPAAARLHPCSAAGKCRRVLCVRATCGARALWGPRSGRDGAGRGISAAQTPPAGAAGGPRAGVVAVATSARGGCRRGGAATTCRAARGGAALRGRGGGQGSRQTREARSALTGRPPCPPEQPRQHAWAVARTAAEISLREVNPFAPLRSLRPTGIISRDPTVEKIFPAAQKLANRPYISEPCRLCS